MYASVFQRDTTPPTLSSAILDLSFGYLRLTFSEVVDPATFLGGRLFLNYYDGTTTINITFSDQAITLNAVSILAC